MKTGVTCYITFHKLQRGHKRNFATLGGGGRRGLGGGGGNLYRINPSFCNHPKSMSHFSSFDVINVTNVINDVMCHINSFDVIHLMLIHTIHLML